jgi:hypothetical protein
MSGENHVGAPTLDPGKLVALALDGTEALKGFDA